MSEPNSAGRGEGAMTANRRAFIAGAAVTTAAEPACLPGGHSAGA